MNKILNLFATSSLYEASMALLNHLSIGVSQKTARPMPAESVFKGVMTKQLEAELASITDIYYIGAVTDETLVNQQSGLTAEEEADKPADQRYKTMVVFAMEARENDSLTRSTIATLTRSLNRRFNAMPIILLVRQGKKLSLSTCERMEYTQAWRNGEKLGKVSILRDIDCVNPHRGHIDILEQLKAGNANTFEKLYQQWMKVFNTKLLTENFYNDLFEWYQWAISEQTGITFPHNPEIVEDDRDSIDIHIIRLITRLMFVWFIKQKDLVPEEIFIESRLKEILKDFDPLSFTSGNYYNAILQNLFFATLNNEYSDRAFCPPAFQGKSQANGVKTLYRDDDKNSWFNISHEEVIKLFSHVPFLNCALFDCLDKSKRTDIGFQHDMLVDGFSTSGAKDKETGHFKRRAFVPNILFFHPDKGILSIFNRYVFTIEENTPQDVQVALDPELLGKVFENLLGAYNPETKETARNQSGSFYTPREIVQYMVNESLVAHLKRTVDKELEPKFRQLLDFTTETINLTDKQKKDILHSLFTCKILDPACGSGAFPMGMLQQMVHILQQVDPDNSQWREVLLNLAVDESRRAFGINDEQERKKKLLEIEETFNNGLNSPDYTRKLYIIESCIYGVDIQPIAMLITRLRFFITLICEQRDIKRDCPEENFGIKTLPNLESKFVAANSLINADIHNYNEDWTNNEELAILKDELMAIRRRHFYTRKRNEKMKLLREDEKKREQIHKLINKIVGEPNLGKIEEYKSNIAKFEESLSQYISEDWEMIEVEEQADLFSPVEKRIVRRDRNKAKREEIQEYIRRNKEAIEKELKRCTPKDFEAAVLQVTDWNPYDQNSVSPFLDIEWMFGVSDGFDIVIGNPPYIQLQADKGKLAKLYEPCGFRTFTKSGDIYCLFYERGNNLLKESGLLCYITSNKWMRAGYGDYLRNYLTQRTNPSLLIDFGETHVFDACVMTNILIFHNENNTFALQSTQLKDDFSDSASLDVYTETNHIYCRFEGNESWVIMPDNARIIKKNVESLGKPLESWNISINYGIKTGYNPAFFISTAQRESILADCHSTDEQTMTEQIIRPMLRGKDIQKYGTNWEKAQIWMINTHNGIKKTVGKKKVTILDPVDIEKLPAIKRHLDKYYAKLCKRYDKGETPYNLRNCAYLLDFDKPKIMYPNMTKHMPFYYDEKRFLQNDKSFFIVGEHISFLTAFLNSSLFKYCFIDNFPPLFGGSRELRKIFFDKVPVLEVDDATDAEFRELVLDIQKEYTDEKAKAIDKKIFDLYGLTQEERDMIGYIDFHNDNNGEEDYDE